MVFGLLHKPPKLDSLNLTLSDVNDLEESMAIKLWERLQLQRERTIEAYKSK